MSTCAHLTPTCAGWRSPVSPLRAPGHPLGHVQGRGSHGASSLSVPVAMLRRNRKQEQAAQVTELRPRGAPGSRQGPLGEEPPRGRSKSDEQETAPGHAGPVGLGSQTLQAHRQHTLSLTGLGAGGQDQGIRVPARQASSCWGPSWERGQQARQGLPFEDSNHPSPSRGLPLTSQSPTS